MHNICLKQLGKVTLCAEIVILIFGCIVIGSCFAEEVDFDKLVPCVIAIESGGRSDVVSNKGCIGIMQISPQVLEEFNDNVRTPRKLCDTPYVSEWAKVGNIEVGVNCIHTIENLFDRNINIKIGRWYLKRIKNHYCEVWNIPDTLKNICVGYNYGVGNLKKWYRAGANYMKLPLETQNYIRKVKRCYE